MMKRLFSVTALVLAILTLGVSAEAQSNPPLRITEVDGSPSKTNATRLNFPNGTISISGGVVTYTPAGGSGLGDVVGPASATDNAIVRFDSTTGKLVQNSAVTIADTSGNMAGVGTLNTHTIPGGTDTFALLAASQALTGKTYNKITITPPATGATLTIPDGVTLNAGAGGTLGSNAFSSTAFVAQTTTVNGKALSGNITLGLASADYANQGTTTTLLHGNAAGNPSFGAASLTADVSGILPTANGGTGVAFFTAAGPTVARVYTFPDAATTILTTNAAVTVAQGGTGLATLTANNVMLGNGTSTPLFVAPGTSGNVLTSNGTTWTSAAPAGGGITIGTTTITGGTDTKSLFNNAGVVGERTVTGTGNDVLSASPTLTGTVGLAALTATGTIVQTSASATAFESGPNGSTNPVFRLVNSTASAATGLSITGKAAGSGVALTVLTSGTNEAMVLKTAGTGTVQIDNGSGDAGLYAISGKPLQIGTISADNIRFHRGGTAVLIINNVGLVDATGSAGTPALIYGSSTGAIYSYNSETSSGLGRVAANSPAIYANGIARSTVTVPKSLTNNTATAITNVTVASNTVASGIVDYVVEAFDGTDLQVETGSFAYQVTNKGGTIANNTITFAGASGVGVTSNYPKNTVTAGTLACTWTITAANPAVLTLNANSSLTPSAGYPRVTYTIRNLTQQAIAIQ